MSQRFGSLHQRDSRSALFEGYTPTASSSASPYAAHPRSSSPYLSQQQQQQQQHHQHQQSHANGAYRSATPNRKGQYSDAVLNELESQNDAHVAGILGKVRVLKDMTVAIGDEIRESSALAEKMNDSFYSTRLRLRGTMNRMLLMAERTGVGWKVWLLFFAAVGLLFFYVWLF